jgi:hypothetical protein
MEGYRHVTTEDHGVATTGSGIWNMRTCKVIAERAMIMHIATVLKAGYHQYTNEPQI